MEGIWRFGRSLQQLGPSHATRQPQGVVGMMRMARTAWMARTVWYGVRKGALVRHPSARVSSLAEKGRSQALWSRRPAVEAWVLV